MPKESIEDYLNKLKEEAERTIPDYMVGAIVQYVEHGIEPGSFLSAVLENDLNEAFGRADTANRYCLDEYVNLLYNFAPRACWKSRENFVGWCKHGGLRGLTKD